MRDEDLMDPYYRPTNNEDYIKWYRAMGMSSTISDFEKKVDDYLEAKKAMIAMQEYANMAGSPPDNVNIYKLRADKDLAIKNLLLFLVGAVGGQVVAHLDEQDKKKP